MYTPVPTNAQEINPYSGTLIPLNPSAWILFSSDADAAAMLALVLAIDPDATLFDGNGILCPPCLYGSDGRKVNCIKGTSTVLGAPAPWGQAVGLLIAQKNYGAMWNQMNEPGPDGTYNAFKFSPEGTGGAIAIDWCYVAPVAMAPVAPTAPATAAPSGPIEVVA
jgi:hypothetical protein